MVWMSPGCWVPTPGGQGNRLSVLVFYFQHLVFQVCSISVSGQSCKLLRYKIMFQKLILSASGAKARSL
jgi:hypothetical protein